MKITLKNVQFQFSKKELKEIVGKLNGKPYRYKYTTWHFFADLLGKTKVAKQKLNKKTGLWEWHLNDLSSKV